ncbi:hypothetical protein [Burkholderia diffusa]|uniref:hypothetical protein n=1 Tax=Burkholderia diffusa TaxID=488732 RepID=UPI0012DAB48B|nr:hypothetical protein [Burkholderia diffusa]
MNFKAADGHTGGKRFLSRAVLLYSYDSQGNLESSSSMAQSVKMDGIKQRGIYTGQGYTIYFGYGLGGSWENPNTVTTNVEIRVSSKAFLDWPGMNVRAGIYTDGDDVGEITGGAYVAIGDVDGKCKVLDPEQRPPPPHINIEMSAADWNLGEVSAGESEKTFTSPAEQLCFTYTGSQVSGKSFIINAENANGIANNRYRLKNVGDSSQLVPYRVILDSGTSKLTLPNTVSSALSLSSSGRTCFVPTFETFVEDRVKEGAYSDVLQFNVVTKP